MLKLYDYLEALLEEHNNRQCFLEMRLDYFASDLIDMLEIEDVAEIEASINRAFNACRTLNIPIGRNFKKVYRFDGSDLMSDWKISPLAGCLIVINCNPSYEAVARAQLFFAMNQTIAK